MSIIQSIKQVLGLSGTASENHFWDGSVPNQLSLKRGTPEAPGAEVIKTVSGQFYVGSLPAYSCRAFCRFNGINVTVYGTAYGISSIVKNATGVWTVTLSSPLPDANYAVHVSSSIASSQVPLVRYEIVSSSSFAVYVCNPSSVLTDSSDISVTVFR